jgi:hypothetical protein
MRKFLLLGFLAFGLSAAVSYGQHAGAAHVAPAPPPAVHVNVMPAVPRVATHAAPAPHSPAAAHPPVMSHPATHTAAPTMRPVVPRMPVASSTAPVRAIRHNGTGPRRNFVPNVSQINECAGAPGLGFDYSHFFAVHPACNHVAFGGAVLPFVGGGSFYVPMPYYSEAAPEQEVAENAPARHEPSQTSDQPAETTEEPAAPAPRQPAYTPLKPVSEFVFVKRDGTRILAVAYSMMNDKIQYVTKEGLRRTVTLDALDFDATEKSNEELGNTINLPKHHAADAV